MIEYGQLTKLDDDYITLMSDYILYQDKDRIIDNMVKLAELGQLNAIKTCCDLIKVKNVKIIKHIEKIIDDRPKNFNEYIILATYFYDPAEQKEIDDLVERYKELEPNRIHTHHFLGRYVEYFIDTDVEGKMNRVLDRIAEYKSVQYLEKAKHTLDCLPYKNPKMTALSLELLEKSESQKLFGTIGKKRKIKKVRKDLLLEVKQKPNDVATKYYLAKNIATFGGNKKEILLGRKILEELSVRPLNIKQVKQENIINQKRENKTNIITNEEELVK